jgi:hypothetical protein
MRSSFVTVFRKRGSCPSSETLLAFLGYSLRYDESVGIEDHLVTCDFCSAESQLLGRHRSDNEEYAFVEMPAHFRRLAEDLLRRGTEPFKAFPQFPKHYHV